MKVMVVATNARSASVWDAAGEKMYENVFSPVPELGSTIEYTPPAPSPAVEPTAKASPAVEPTAKASPAVEPTAKAK
jgi:hypothetical protein